MEEENDPESLQNRLRDFDDDYVAPVPDHPSPITEVNPPPTIADTTQPQAVTPNKLPPIAVAPVTSATLGVDESPARLDESWVQRFCTTATPSPGAMQLPLKSALPKLQVPMFAGDPLEWPSFIAMFKCVVHDQPLTDTQRMTYLQRSLTRDAQKAVEGMLNHGHRISRRWRSLKSSLVMRR